MSPNSHDLKKEPTVDRIDIDLRPLSGDEQNQVFTAMQRARVFDTVNTHLRTIGFSRRGRFTLCLLEATTRREETKTDLLKFGMPIETRGFFWGACRLDPRDEDRQEAACKLTLAKACSNLVEWLKDEQRRKAQGPINDPGDEWSASSYERVFAAREKKQPIPTITLVDRGEPPFESLAPSFTHIDADGETQRRGEKDRILLD